MFLINIITVGGEKEEYFSAASAEYRKRLSRDCKLSCVELKAEKLSPSPSEKEISSALEKEAERVLPLLSKGFNVALCVEGKQLSTEKFSLLLEKAAAENRMPVNFVIGSSFGLSERVKAACGLRLSLSEMTFAHRLASVMLHEQIYRAVNMINGGKYNK
ncbi:MAG: 23S rRNA (pseudouridine(1915)-N(3))-methyltransferase RlmH [Clostridia bacterium]|nr:23S rRNA (pseudouridine(1915)-N(3))-methyltransferase RlmH [Clostridia bacterium]